MSINLLGLTREEMTQFFIEKGEKPFRAKQVMKWIHQMGVTHFDEMTDVAKSLREKLKDLATLSVPKMISEQVSQDGTRKWLLELTPGNAIETVFIPEDDRGTLCVSSQIGCALACTFCSTGRQGFNRNLTTAEIIGQIWWANKALGRDPKGERIISNVVLMGMGEPLLNYDAVINTLSILLDDMAYGLSRRRVTLSTSGVLPALKRLEEQMPVALAVSLHAPNDELRNKIVPINQKYPLQQLMEACRSYVRAGPRDFITFEYVMLKEVNDTDEHARQLIELVKGIPCKFNLIPFNPFPDSGYETSTTQRIRAFKELLIKQGYIVTVRKTRGEDIDAACGQLAGKVIDKSRRHIKLSEILA